MTLEEMTAQHPELLEQIRNDAAAAERKRLSDIDDVAMDGFERIVAAAKEDPKATAESVAMQIIREAKNQGNAFLKGRKKDADTSGANGIENQTPEEGSGQDDLDNVLDKLFPKA